MKRLYQALAFIVASYIPVEVVSHVVSSNAFANLYPPEADSISIPIFGALFNALVLVFVALVGIFLPVRGWWRYVRLLPLGLASLWSFSPILYWLSPNHYWISASYLIPLGVVGYLFFCSVNNGQKPTKVHGVDYESTANRG